MTEEQILKEDAGSVNTAPGFGNQCEEVGL
jgi:hypothetical protein